MQICSVILRPLRADTVQLIEELVAVDAVDVDTTGAAAMTIDDPASATEGSK
jgi:hypothetical protein